MLKRYKVRGLSPCSDLPGTPVVSSVAAVGQYSVAALENNQEDGLELRVNNVQCERLSNSVLLK